MAHRRTHRSRSWACRRRGRASLAARFAFGIAAAAGLVPTIAPEASATTFKAVMIGVNYPGGPAFDDNARDSAVALRTAMASWKNWIYPNMTLMDADTTATEFTDKITEVGNTLGAGDGLFVFYFGHNHQGATNAGRINELETSANNWDEALHFQDDSLLSDDDLTATLSALDPDLNVIATIVGCWSEGFWNGNDIDGAGDLSSRNKTVAMWAASETQVVGSGNMGPRPNEPLYLKNLIDNAWRNGRQNNLDVKNWANASQTNDSGFGGRFGDPDWVGPHEWEADSGWGATSGTEDFEFFLVPEPSSGLLVALGLSGVGLTRRSRPSADGRNGRVVDPR